MNFRDNYSRRNSGLRFKKTMKDYLVPIIGLIIIFLLIYSIIFSGKGNSKKEQVFTGTVLVSLEENGTEAYIRNSKYESELIKGDTKVSNGNALVVKKGVLEIEDEKGIYRLNKLGEVEIKEKNKLELVSSDLWGKSKGLLEIDMAYARLKFSSGSIFSLNQNDIISTIYIISGSAEVSNLVGQKTLLGNGQKLMIKNGDASNKKLDLSIAKDNLDKFFIDSDWYIKNSSGIGTSSGSIGTGSVLSNTGKINTKSGDSIVLNNIRDEMVVSSYKIDISGKYNNDFVSKITLDGKNARLNKESKSFSFGTINLTKKENDLVIKLFDTDDNVIEKNVFTLYFNGDLPEEKKAETKKDQENDKKPTVTNYSLKSSKFKFTSPNKNPFTTKTDFVTIRGTVPKGEVEKIIVNGYTLQRFPKYGTDWRYHADKKNGNLKDGLNIYQVRYIGEGGKQVYQNTFTIVKE